MGEMVDFLFIFQRVGYQALGDELVDNIVYVAPFDARGLMDGLQGGLFAAQNRLVHFPFAFRKADFLPEFHEWVWNDRIYNGVGTVPRSFI